MKVIGIGNALVDIMTSINDDNFLVSQNLPKGSMQLVDKETSDKLMAAISAFDTKIASGGSAANTINGLAKMNIQTGFLGKLGHDELGKHFIKDLTDNKVTPHISYSDSLSGKAIALVSPDGERTFATFLGAAVEMTADDIKDDLFDSYNILHIEGYLLQNYELIEKAVSLAKKKGLKVSLDLASYNVVESNLDFLNKLIPNNVDILFANEEESKAFIGLEPERAVVEIGKMVPMSIVKIGANGSLVFTNNEITKISAIKSDCIDTTGAGDLYAAGFIYGLSKNCALSDCGRIGSLLSGNVIKVIGAKMHTEMWEEIYKQI